jgi:hypothetical protein
VENLKVENTEFLEVDEEIVDLATQYQHSAKRFDPLGR